MQYLVQPVARRQVQIHYIRQYDSFLLLLSTNWNLDGDPEGFKAVITTTLSMCYKSSMA